jgi:hypothetical protein
VGGQHRPDIFLTIRVVISRVNSFILQGIDAAACEIEADLSPVGLPKTTIVGLPDVAVKESTERVRTALLNSGYRFPQTRLTINLAPADVRKEGTGFDLPIANYATMPFDKVLSGGKLIGVSTYTGYTVNERAMVSLAVLDAAHSEPGTEVAFVWGEEGKGSSKPTVERHAQTEIRATVAPAPISQVAREAYRPRAA